MLISNFLCQVREIAEEQHRHTHTYKIQLHAMNYSPLSVSLACTIQHSYDSMTSTIWLRHFHPHLTHSSVQNEWGFHAKCRTDCVIPSGDQCWSELILFSLLFFFCFVFIDSFFVFNQFVRWARVRVNGGSNIDAIVVIATVRVGTAVRVVRVL